MSSLLRMDEPESEFLPILLLNFILPTSDKSYLSGLKKRFWKRFSDESLVGGSPGRIILYISTSASSFEDDGSILREFEM